MVYRKNRASASVILATLSSPALRVSPRIPSSVLYRKCGLIWFWSARYCACFLVALISLSLLMMSCTLRMASSITGSNAVGTSNRPWTVYPVTKSCRARELSR